MENKPLKIAVVVTNGFEESELRDPVRALQENGMQPVIIAPAKGSIRSWKDKDWGANLAVDQTFQEVSSGDFDGLLIPGGTLNCDKLRMVEDAVSFIREFFEQHKPVAAICHGPQLLIEADVVKGRKLTSYSAIKTDLINAGADWEDAEVVVDQGLVTSRTPKDLPAFINKMLEEFREGQHDGQHT